MVLTPTGVYILDSPESSSGSWAEADNFPSGFKASHLVVDPGAMPSGDSTVYISSAETGAPTGIYTFGCSLRDCKSNANTVSWFQRYNQPVHSLFAQGNVSVYAGAEDINGNHQVIKTTDNGANWDSLNTVTPINGTSPIDLLYSSGSRLIAISTAEGPAGIRGLSTLPLETAWVNLGNNLFVNGGTKISGLTVAGTDVYLGLSHGGVRTLDLSASQGQWNEAQWFDYSQPQSNQSPERYTLNLLKGFPAGNTPTSLWAATTEQGVYRTDL